MKIPSKTKTELMEEIETKNKEIKDLKKEIEKLDRFKVYEETANEIAAVRDPLEPILTKTTINTAMNLANKTVSYKKY